MQGFNTTTQNLGSTGIVGYFGNGHSGIFQGLGGAAAADDVKFKGIYKLAGKFDDAGFVGNAEEGEGHDGMWGE